MNREMSDCFLKSTEVDEDFLGPETYWQFSWLL
jgi:hypothetical protein